MALRTQSISPNIASRDDETDPLVTYYGQAEVGTLDSESKWAIKRFRVVGGVIVGECAKVTDKKHLYVNKWSDRATLEYQ